MQPLEFLFNPYKRIYSLYALFCVYRGEFLASGIILTRDKKYNCKIGGGCATIKHLFF